MENENENEKENEQENDTLEKMFISLKEQNEKEISDLKAKLAERDALIKKYMTSSTDEPFDEKTGGEKMVNEVVNIIKLKRGIKK